MADPINWGAFDPSQTAAGLQALQPHVINQYTNQNAFQAAQGSPAELQYQAQMAQTRQQQQAGMIQYLAGMQQRAIDQQNANSTQLTAQANAANLGVVNQRENAVAEANIDKTNAETAGSQIDVASKAREEQKQQILLQAAQSGGLSGYMDALQSLDPDKYLDVTKKQQDITTGILGQKKSILDLQGTQRDQAVKSFSDMNKLLYAVETSPNPQGTYKQLLPTLQQISPDSPDDYNDSWVTGHFLAGLNAVGGSDGKGGGIAPSAISALPGNVQGTAAFAGGAPAPIQARAASMAALAPVGISAANNLSGMIQAHGGVPILGAASQIPGLGAVAKVTSSTAAQYSSSLEQYKAALMKAGVDTDQPEGAGYLPIIGQPEESLKNVQKGTALLNSLSTQVNPKQIGVSNPMANPLGLASGTGDPLGLR